MSFLDSYDNNAELQIRMTFLLKAIGICCKVIMGVHSPDNLLLEPFHLLELRSS